MEAEKKTGDVEECYKLRVEIGDDYPHKSRAFSKLLYHKPNFMIPCSLTQCIRIYDVIPSKKNIWIIVLLFNFNDYFRIN